MKAPELLKLSIEWLKSEYPDSTIVTEMSVADWGNARIDVAAITDDEMVGIEIKGEGDSPTRLELQGITYGQVARKMWLLVTPEGTLSERCRKKRPRGWGVLAVEDGKVAPRIRSQFGDGTVWHDKPGQSQQFNPYAMCGTLWRDELFDLAVRKNLQPGKKARVADLTETIVDHLPVPEIHDAMIFQLRRRIWKKPVIDLRIHGHDGKTSNRKAPDRPGHQGRLGI